MSADNERRQIESVNRELASLHDKLSRERKTEADKFKRINTVEGSITKNTSASSLKSKAREVDRLQTDIARSKQKQASLSKQIATKEKKKHDHEKRLMQEQQKEQRKYQRDQERILNEHREELNRQLAAASAVGSERREQEPPKDYDVFISHASEDKEHLVRDLAEKLRGRGYSVWYDEFELTIGDSLRRKIDQGLANSRYGIVVLSPAFFAKEWPQRELDGLVAKEVNAREKVILPIWHKMSKDEVASYSPTLADKMALTTAIASTDEIVDELARVLGPQPLPDGDTPMSDLPPKKPTPVDEAVRDKIDRLIREIAKEQGIGLPRVLNSAHLDADDREHLHRILDIAKQRHPEHADTIDEIKRSI